MTKNLDLLLLNKYPEFFDNFKSEVPLEPIKFYFECDDGWFTLLDTLFETIQIYQKNTPTCEPVQVLQVKTKFGRLCFYYSGGDDDIALAVRLAERVSYKTCEICGKTDNVGRTTGWVVTICKECFDNGVTRQKDWFNECDWDKKFGRITKSEVTNEGE